MERDGWILMQSASPKQAAIWLADKRDALGDTEFRAIYLEYDAAFDWSPHDARLNALAARSERWFAKQHDKLEGPERSPVDPTLARLVAASVGMSSPAWDRLTEIGQERKAGVTKAPATSR